jgi:hypothetical protein
MGTLRGPKRQGRGDASNRFHGMGRGNRLVQMCRYRLGEYLDAAGSLSPGDDMRGNSPAAPHEESFGLLLAVVSSPNITLWDVSAAVVATASRTA